MNAQIVAETVGPGFSECFAFLPAQRTRGGALLVVNVNYYTVLCSEFREHPVLAKLQSTSYNLEWWITGMYGPQGNSTKLFFQNELRGVSLVIST